MALTKKQVTGMKDILPAEMKIRDYVMNQIKETYSGFGFQSIETQCVEHITNITSKQGGDNEKLIFKILKRGEKLNLEAVIPGKMWNVISLCLRVCPTRNEQWKCYKA